MQAINQLDNELTVIQPHSVDLVKDVKSVEDENRKGLQVLKKILDNKKDKVIIKGKRHIEFEDWIAIGNAYGVTVRTGSAEPIEIFDSKGFKACAEVIRLEDGVVIGGAEALCLNNEHNWKNKDYFQMASMAQTRAGSKALSNVLRFVVALDKTLSGTPAEEIIPKKVKNNIRKKSTKKDNKESLTLEEAASQCMPIRAIIKNLKYKGIEVTLDNIRSQINKNLSNDGVSKKTYASMIELLDRVK